MPKLMLKLFFLITLLTGLHSVNAVESCIQAQQAKTNESIAQKLKKSLKDRNVIFFTTFIGLLPFTIAGGVWTFKGAVQKVQQRRALKDLDIKVKDYCDKKVSILKTLTNNTGRVVEISTPFWSFKKPQVTTR